jgi:hypothetical protein
MALFIAFFGRRFTDVKFSKNIIETRLSHFAIPQGQCGESAFRIAEMLLGRAVIRAPGRRYASIADLLVQISAAVANEQLAIVWLDTGPVDPGNPNRRAICMPRR